MSDRIPDEFGSRFSNHIIELGKNILSVSLLEFAADKFLDSNFLMVEEAEEHGDRFAIDLRLMAERACPCG